METLHMNDFESEDEAMAAWLSQSFQYLYDNHKPSAFILLARTDEGVSVMNYRADELIMLDMIDALTHSLHNRLDNGEE